MIVYEFLDSRGAGVLVDWPLEDMQRKALNRRLRQLNQIDWRLAVGSLLFKTDEPEIYEFEVYTNVQLRPMTCLGPEKPREEVTFLARAVERDNVILPKNVREIASANLEVLKKDLKNRRKQWTAPATQS